MLSKGQRVSLSGRNGIVMRTDACFARGVVVKWDDDSSSSAFFGDDIKKLQLCI